MQFIISTKQTCIDPLICNSPFFNLTFFLPFLIELFFFHVFIQKPTMDTSGEETFHPPPLLNQLIPVNPSLKWPAVLKLSLPAKRETGQSVKRPSDRTEKLDWKIKLEFKNDREASARVYLNNYSLFGNYAKMELRVVNEKNEELHKLFFTTDRERSSLFINSLIIKSSHVLSFSLDFKGPDTSLRETTLFMVTDAYQTYDGILAKMKIVEEGLSTFEMDTIYQCTFKTAIDILDSGDLVIARGKPRDNEYNPNQIMLYQYSAKRDIKPLAQSLLENFEDAQKDVVLAVLGRLMNEKEDRRSQRLVGQLIVKALCAPSTDENDWASILPDICLKFVKDSDEYEEEVATKVLSLAVKKCCGVLKEWKDAVKDKPNSQKLFETIVDAMAEEQTYTTKDAGRLICELPTDLSLTDQGDIPNRCCGVADLRRLEPVRKNKPYKNWEHYVKVYHDLFRADCFYEFAKSLSLFQESEGKGFRAKQEHDYFDEQNMAVFYGIKLYSTNEKSECCQEHFGTSVFQIVCQPRSAKSVRMSNLMTGNLLALSIDGTFKSVVWLKIEGTLSFHEKKLVHAMASAPGQMKCLPRIMLDVSFCKNLVFGKPHINYTDIMEKITFGVENAVLVELNTLYMSFGPPLQFLQKCLHNIADISPLFKDVFALGAPPKEIEEEEVAQLKVIQAQYPELFQTLDVGQRMAFQHFVENRLTLIQGPPGTGKSYLTARIIFSLLHADEKEKILVVSYKNHAIDEMLKDVVAIEEGLMKNRQRGQLLAYSFVNKTGQLHLENVRNRGYGVVDDKVTQRFREIVRLGNSKKMDQAFAKYTLKAMEGERNTEQSFSESKCVERIACQLQHTVKELQSPLTFNQEEFEEYFPELAEQSKALKDKQWYKPGLVFLCHWIHKPKEGGCDASLLTRWKKKVEEEEKTIEDAIDYQNATEKRAEQFEDEEQKKDVCRIMTSNPRAAVTLSDFEAEYPQTRNTVVTCKWTSIPMEKIEQAHLLKAFFSKKLQRLHNTFNDLCDDLQKATERANMYNYELQLSKIKDKRLAFCTMTGCAIYHNILQHYGPTVLVIEEAAEIPEPCLISALFPSVRRVVMVGDHKQLPASVQSYDLEKKGLDISAFERLINLGLEHRTLVLQNRMVDELIWMVKPFYDHYETNLRLVKELNSSILATLGPLRVFWWTHEYPENPSCSGKGSRSNRHEVEMVHNVCRAFITSNIDPSMIVVLTGYAGQKREIQMEFAGRARSHPNASKLKAIDVATIDEFQGNEREIVVLSMVRTGKPGFMKRANRMVVALSRQKVCLIIVGNKSTFANQPHWGPFIEELEKRKAIGPNISFTCPRHPDKNQMILKSDETAFQEGKKIGFCQEQCNHPFSCGHRCTLPCHSSDVPHEDCHVPVKVYCQACGTTHNIECYQKDTFKCCQQITWNCEQGHLNTLECWDFQDKKKKEEERQKQQLECMTSEQEMNQDTQGVIPLFQCSHPCDKLLSCGHKCPRLCGQPCPDRWDCPKCIEKHLKRIPEADWDKIIKEIKARIRLAQARVPRCRIGITQQRTQQRTPLQGRYAKSIFGFFLNIQQPDSPLRLNPFTMAVSRMCEEDFFSLVECDSLSEPVGLKQYLLDAAQGLTRMVLDNLEIKMPRSFMGAPQCWLFLSLLSILDDHAIKDFREVFSKWKEKYNPENAQPLCSWLQKKINDAETVIWEITTKHGGKILAHFKEAPMTELATIIISTLCTQGYSFLRSDTSAQTLTVLTPEMISKGREFQCMMELDGTLGVNPPYDEVPKRELYLEGNAGKAFVSFVLPQAEFTIFRLVYPRWANGRPTWESFVTDTLMYYPRGFGETLLPCIQKLPKLYTRLFSQLSHNKNVALQSFVLCLVVRALIRRLLMSPGYEFPVTRIFRISSDELIFECRTPQDQDKVLQFVKSVVNMSLRGLEPSSRIEAFVLHKFDLTPSMKRLAGMAREMTMEDDMLTDSRARLSDATEEVMEDSWKSGHETEVERRNPDVFFVRETRGIQKRFNIETLPCELLTEAIPFVAEHFHLCEPPPQEQPLPEKQPPPEKQPLPEKQPPPEKQPSPEEQRPPEEQPLPVQRPFRGRGERLPRETRERPLRETRGRMRGTTSSRYERGYSMK